MGQVTMNAQSGVIFIEQKKSLEGRILFLKTSVWSKRWGRAWVGNEIDRYMFIHHIKQYNGVLPPKSPA